MATTTQTNVTKLDQIMASAQRNRQEARKVDTESLSAEDEERLKSSDITERQMKALDRLRVEYDPRPLAEGGTCSRWNASHLIAEAYSGANGRRAVARAKPITDAQIQGLLKWGCNVQDIEDLTAGEASDLFRQFGRTALARNKMLAS